MRRLLFIATLGLAGAATTGCGDVTVPEGEPSVTLSVAVPGAVAEAGVVPRASADLVQVRDGTTLRLTRVALVLREVELERTSVDDCDSSGTGNPCHEFEAGPFLLELPLDGSVRQVATVVVPPDSYDELEFDIHKPDDDTPEELAFLQEHPDFEGVSVRVEGTFDGEPFVFLQDLNEEQEVRLEPPLVVTEGSGPVDLTLTLDVSTWFTGTDGSLLDPRSANEGGPNEELVEERIRASIDLFEDDDRDGRRD